MEPLERAAALLRRSRSAVALTGAGISTPSGIPDFRSPRTGLWQDVDAFEVASLSGFRRCPEAFFKWVSPLLHRIVQAQPNPAHYALARLEQAGVITAVITQNIDMLHSRAGTRTLYELHGHLREATCMECFGVFPADEYVERFLRTGDLPYCPMCGGVLKPNVVLFGEDLPVPVLRDAQRAARRCDVMLIAGSSLEIAPASELPMMAHAHGADIIVINYQRTYIDRYAAAVIHDDVAEVLPRLADRVGSGEKNA